MSTPLPVPPKGARRLFVSFLDSPLGRHLVETLLARKEQPGAEYEITGVLRDPANAASVPGVSKGTVHTLQRGDAEGLRKTLLAADWVVLHTPESVDDTVRALRVLAVNHVETEKRVVLVSSVMSWYETVPLQDPIPAEDPDEPPETETLTEDQYNRRVPHLKYQAWREAEKLCCSLQSERLKTFVVFAGLMYGQGETRLQPLFRQAWTLASEGLPVYGNGNQYVPMIHTADCSTFVKRILAFEELPENRYFFAVDEGNCTWKAAMKALTNVLGNGKTFTVPPAEYGMHDSAEHFLVNLQLSASQIQQSMPEETDWVCKAGFVENIEKICSEFRAAHGVTPLRIVLLGPPSAGKSYTARELAQHYKLPCYTVADVLAEYRSQDVELSEEILRLKEERLQLKRNEKLEEKRQIATEERKARQADAAEAAATSANPTGDGGEAAGSGAGGGGGAAGSPLSVAQTTMLLSANDDDDEDEEEPIEVDLTADEETECAQLAADEAEGDERIQAVIEKLQEVKRVLGMKLKPLGTESVEPPNPKDKKKPAPKAKKSAKDAAKEAALSAEKAEEARRNAGRLSDRALGIMMRWKLTRTACRNQGYVLDGFPKTIRQARLAFEDMELEVPEDPENEPDMPLDAEERPYLDSLMPDYIIHTKAPESFLLERLLKTQHEHRHNTPEDFQRRLEAYKTHFEGAPLGVIQHLESARSTTGRSCSVQPIETDAAPLVPPPPPASQFETRPMDVVAQKIVDLVGRPHNFGPSPEDAQEAAERTRQRAAELQSQALQAQEAQHAKEQSDVRAAEESRSAELERVRAMKNAERAMLEQRKGPLKQFLMANVIPVLTKGLIEVCNQRPEDPVDFLAEWLFRHNPEDHPELYA